MSDYEQIALHFYHEIAPQIQGKVGVSFQRQHRDVLENLEKTIERYGAETASAQLRAIASYSQTYDGRNNPSMQDIVNAISEMSAEGIQPDSQQWREQIQAMGDRNLIRTVSTNADGETRILENAQPNFELEASDPLSEALAYQRTQLKHALADRDEQATARIEKTIKLIERDLQSLNGSTVPDPATPDRPVMSPEAQARQAAADKEYNDSVDRHDARVEAERNEDAA